MRRMMRRRSTSFQKRWWQPQPRGKGRREGIGRGGTGERGYSYSWCAVFVCFGSLLLFSCCSYCEAFVVPAQTRPVLPYPAPKPGTAFSSSSLTARGAVSPENNDDEDDEDDDEKQQQQQSEQTWTSDFDGFTVGDDGSGWTADFESFKASDNDTKKKKLEDTTARKKKNKTKPSKNSDTRNDLEELVYDDDDEEDDDGTTSTDTSLSEFLSNGGGTAKDKQNADLTAVRTRLFSLGEDLMIQDYVGTLGFEEVTDWQYYYQDVDEDGNPANDKSNTKTSSSERKIVTPNPFDQATPKRTRTASGSVVRIFRGQFIGRLGGSIRSQGDDARIIIKEFTGTLAQSLARQEQTTLGILQSQLLEAQIVRNTNTNTKKKDDEDDPTDTSAWIQAAGARSVLGRTDDKHVTQLLQALSQKAPYLGILGEVNLAEMLDLEDGMDPNDFYRALGVPPPKPDAIWIVYEYQGLNTLATYTQQPPELRRAQIPVKKGFFGNAIPTPPLPTFPQRANYIIKDIMVQCLTAVATLHEAGIAHRSIGRNSFLITSTAQDKSAMSSIYCTQQMAAGKVRIKLSDFGFAGLLRDSLSDPEFCARARSFGLTFPTTTKYVRDTDDTDVKLATQFAMAEDLHALGFVFLGLVLVTLAEIKAPLAARMPPTDEDTLQKLVSDIFNQDFAAFRDYVEAEEEIWGKLVVLLDAQDSAGWNVLETLFTARELTVKQQHDQSEDDGDTTAAVTARGLLAHRFFQ